MAAVNEGKALELIAKAEKKSKSFWPGSAKYEDAHDMFTRGANMLKVARKWDEAGDAFEKAAAMSAKLGEPHDEASDFVAAAGCYRKTQTGKAVTCLQRAVDLFTNMGRFTVAAKHTKDIAEMYEEDQELESAINFYESAAQFYEGENSTAMATKCLLKAATFLAQLEKYDRAIEIFEQAGIGGIDNNLTQFKCKEYFLHAVLCHLATGEAHTARAALDRYQDLDAKFVGSREAEFANSLVTAVEDADVDAFTAAIVDFDRITKLSNWRTTILLRVKQAIQAEEDDLT
ncbi:alpha-soluble NSF attachment protein [Thecamonas trahens ATCC 50062]|uniref:Alpha-soluble NSF attachment protein n=1 Tax=Thecamonas trahens ATCC 50062 TaxID=461836 RepID=A0A0L0D4Q7_THETB|nr:alpha-soluble NSF attachment protein [Thecamonas trahens ATCC 50062]KNC47225.1 alpha-soluble NSF attachment protein [Thecamonas trahens ATCC 50062]|eukprot:XP_013759994.1 alpha-soluble NSF attachment protein [Thecamonas trahens ATCC 50062]